MNSRKKVTKTIHSSLSKVDSAEGCVDQFIDFPQHSSDVLKRAFSTAGYSVRMIVIIPTQQVSIS